MKLYPLHISDRLALLWQQYETAASTDAKIKTCSVDISLQQEFENNKVQK